MLKSRHRLLLAGALAAVLAIGAGAAIGATGSSGDSFLADVAKRLGISEEKLTDAIEDARIAQIDAAVKAGDLTQAQGEALKERVRSGEGPAFGFGRGFGHHGPHHLGGGSVFEAAAKYLGVTEAALHETLRENEQTLAELARAKGKSVDGLKTAVRNAIQADLEEAVADGKLTQAQADRMAEELDEKVDRIVDEGFRGRGFHRHGGPGFAPDELPAGPDASFDRLVPAPPGAF